MFWKKKQQTSELIHHDRTTQRETYRYYPPDHRRIPCSFQGREIRICNLSAGGISFLNNGFSEEDTGEVVIHLEDAGMKEPVTISTQLTVLSIDERDICHCSFVNLSIDEQEHIHQYLLIKQKQDIQQKKRDPSH